MLVQAYLKLPRPDIDAALAANHKQIELLESDEALGQAWLLRGELQLKKDQRQEALKTLANISAKAPRALRLPARLLRQTHRTLFTFRPYLSQLLVPK